MCKRYLYLLVRSPFAVWVPNAIRVSRAAFFDFVARFVKALAALLNRLASVFVEREAFAATFFIFDGSVSR